jgi:hypothetical protein
VGIAPVDWVFAVVARRFRTTTHLDLPGAVAAM